MGKIIQLKFTDKMKAKNFLHDKLSTVFPDEFPWWCDMVAEIMEEYADKRNQIP